MLDLIDAYENYLTKVRQASANTVASYMRDIRQFAEWLQQSEELDVVEAAQLNISRYLSHLEDTDTCLIQGRYFPKQTPYSYEMPQQYASILYR